MSAVQKYIRSVRNPAKRAYASDYLSFRVSSTPRPESLAISPMAAQCVRLRIDGFLEAQTPIHKFAVGDYAQSIESGWLGKIVDSNGSGFDLMFEMHHVNELCRAIKGGDIAEFIEADDTRWFAPEDLRPVKLV